MPLAYKPELAARGTFEKTLGLTIEELGKVTKVTNTGGFKCLARWATPFILLRHDEEIIFVNPFN